MRQTFSGSSRVLPALATLQLDQNTDVLESFQQLSTLSIEKLAQLENIISTETSNRRAQTTKDTEKRDILLASEQLTKLIQIEKSLKILRLNDDTAKLFRSLNSLNMTIAELQQLKSTVAKQGNASSRYTHPDKNPESNATEKQEALNEAKKLLLSLLDDKITTNKLYNAKKETVSLQEQVAKHINNATSLTELTERFKHLPREQYDTEKNAFYTSLKNDLNLDQDNETKQLLEKDNEKILKKLFEMEQIELLTTTELALLKNNYPDEFQCLLNNSCLLDPKNYYDILCPSLWGKKPMELLIDFSKEKNTIFPDKKPTVDQKLYFYLWKTCYLPWKQYLADRNVPSPDKKGKIPEKVQWNLYSTNFTDLQNHAALGPQWLAERQLQALQKLQLNQYNLEDVMKAHTFLTRVCHIQLSQQKQLLDHTTGTYLLSIYACIIRSLQAIQTDLDTQSQAPGVSENDKTIYQQRIKQIGEGILEINAAIETRLHQAADLATNGPKTREQNYEDARRQFIPNLQQDVVSIVYKYSTNKTINERRNVSKQDWRQVLAVTILLPFLPIILFLKLTHLNAKPYNKYIVWLKGGTNTSFTLRNVHDDAKSLLDKQNHEATQSLPAVKADC